MSDSEVFDPKQPVSIIGVIFACIITATLTVAVVCIIGCAVNVLGSIGEVMRGRDFEATQLAATIDHLNEIDVAHKCTNTPCGHFSYNGKYVVVRDDLHGQYANVLFKPTFDQDGLILGLEWVE